MNDKKCHEKVMKDNFGMERNRTCLDFLNLFLFGLKISKYAEGGL